MQTEKKRILEMVEGGKLTASEALILLEQLDETSKKEEEKQNSFLFELEEEPAGNHKKKSFTEKLSKDESFNQKVMVAKDKIFGFVDTALNKIKDFDLDLNFGSYFEVAHVYQTNDLDFTEISAEVSNGTIEIIPWATKEVRVECEARIYRAKDELEARSLFQAETSFGIKDGSMAFLNRQKSMKIAARILIPDHTYEQIAIRIFNGSAQGENLKARSIKAKTANGKIHLVNISGEEAEIDTANGGIILDQASFQKLAAETINGPISVSGAFHSIDVNSFNGEVKCLVENETCERVRAKAVTGSIDLVLPDGAGIDADLRTNLGGFNVNLGGIDVIEEKKDVAKKALRFKADGQKGERVYILAETMSGSISVLRNTHSE
ncbi:DUF4097 family beta strand repeat-containing protein [Peribacillus kribbensis]|uniref:DUF4097 family beta strand repeat-containing protein n=1 Tax=Peribacillus kribbensis TaxID=356658 RepID=UPI00041494ED|nr:DUF4097 domain-containing protein [Peribacillus kribbensis]